MKNFLEFVKQTLLNYYLNFIFIISFLAVLGSLYYSEVADLPPCDLCWYQRVCMYPLSVLAVVGILSNDKKTYRYVTPLAIIGLIIGIYNYLLQKTDWFVTLKTCSADNPCSEIGVQYLGFITIPLMASVGFAAILALTFGYWYFQKQTQKRKKK